jgi:signal transduction histidine kinase
LAVGVLPAPAQVRQNVDFLLPQGEAVFTGVPVVFFGVAPSNLAAPSIWGPYKWYILGVALFLLQTALVVGLLVNRARYRRAEMARQESEQRRQRAEDEAQRQRDELAQALRIATLGELTASLSHELGQPLTAIVANAQAARRLFAADPANPEVREALDDLVAEANRAAEIMRRLRALFRQQPFPAAPPDQESDQESNQD